MKVTLQVEVEVEPERELNAREEKNVAGMLQRMIRHRLEALNGRRAGGEAVSTGWEVHITSVEAHLLSKVK